MAKKTIKSTNKKTNGRKKLDVKMLKQANLVLGLLLLIQGVVIAVIGNSYALPIVSQFFTSDSLASQASGGEVLAPAAHRLFDVPVVYTVSAILIIAALISLAAATIWIKTYESDLKAGLNRLRWATTAAVGGLVVLLVGLLSGVTDIALLVAMFALVEVLALFSVLLESQPELKKHPRVVSKLTGVSALTPWLVIFIYIFGSIMFGSGLPAYSYWLAGSAFAIVAAKAFVMYSHGNKKGKFADNLYTEQAYIILNFVLVSAVAWQVYFGVLG